MSAATKLWYSVLERVRDKRAAEVTEARTTGFDHLGGSRHLLLVSFRRNGEAVPTPVWFGIDDGVVYARSEEGVGKVKRIRANPRVLVAPCDGRGKPKGPAAEGRARILEQADEETAERAIQANFGLGRSVYTSIGPKSVYIGVMPV